MAQSELRERSPRVSVVIPVYNGEKTIERCLESILAQRPPFDYEIIVADSSSDSTPEIVAERFPGVRLVRLADRAFPGTARNEAIRVARGAIIAMTDSDCVVDPHWLERMVARHESGEYSAVGGAIRSGTPTSASGTIGYLLEFREFIPSSPLREVVTVPTANISYRRDVFERFGLFDDVRASEDLLFNWRISLGGERILFDPEIVVTHLNRTGWSTVISYQAVLGEGSAGARQQMDPPFEVLRSYPALGWLLPYLMRYPLLGVFIPPVRLTRAATWLLKYDLGLLAWLMAFAPGYLAGAFYWALAFVRGLRVERPAAVARPRLEETPAGE